MLWDLPYFTLTVEMEHLLFLLIISRKPNRSDTEKCLVLTFSVLCFNVYHLFLWGYLFILETTTENHRPQKSKQKDMDMRNQRHSGIFKKATKSKWSKKSISLLIKKLPHLKAKKWNLHWWGNVYVWTDAKKVIICLVIFHLIRNHDDFKVCV